MNQTKINLFSSISLCLLASLFSACRTCIEERNVIPEVKLQNVSLQEAIEKVNLIAANAYSCETIPILVFDESEAEIEWCNISTANTNIASQLICKYKDDLESWNTYSQTNKISFDSRWISLYELSDILAAMSSGGVLEKRDKNLLIRFASNKLELRQYPHNSWYYVLDEDRFHENGEYYHTLISSEYGYEWPYTMYNPETDSILVFGTKLDHKEFQNFIKHYKINK